MLTIEMNALDAAQRQGWLQHAIAPRPIAFASTIDKEGNVNLSPFSFFNLVSTAPPVVIFSASRRVRNNTDKHTHQNILEVPEVCISICDEDMVQQVSLASCDYAKGVDEYLKAGFTKKTADHIQPPYVAEAKVSMECKVLETKSLGSVGGSGQLIIAEVICIHVQQSVLNEQGTMIDQKKLHHIARLGGNWYCRVNETNLFEVPKPNTQTGIGIDALPASIRNSSVLSGNNLAMLANVHEMPMIDASYDDDRLKQIIQYYSINPEDMEKELHIYAKELLNNNNVTAAWQVLLCAG